MGPDPKKWSRVSDKGHEGCVHSHNKIRGYKYCMFAPDALSGTSMARNKKNIVNQSPIKDFNLRETELNPHSNIHCLQNSPPVYMGLLVHFQSKILHVSYMVEPDYTEENCTWKLYFHEDLWAPWRSSPCNPCLMLLPKYLLECCVEVVNWMTASKDRQQWCSNCISRFHDKPIQSVDYQLYCISLLA